MIEGTVSGYCSENSIRRKNVPPSQGVSSGLVDETLSIEQFLPDNASIPEQEVVLVNSTRDSIRLVL